MEKQFLLIDKLSQSDAIEWDFNTDKFISIIKSINDDSNAKKIFISSIPSPFARIHLFIAAFEYVNSLNDLDSNSFYHKLVSECLDLYEINFLFINGFIKNLEFVSWNVKSFETENTSEPSRLLSSSINLFLKNEDLFSHLNIVKYKNQIIGAFSDEIIPFSSPNAEQCNIVFPDFRMPFSGKPIPLYKRSNDFQIFFKNQILASPQNKHFRTIVEYIRLNHIILNEQVSRFSNSNYQINNVLKNITNELKNNIAKIENELFELRNETNTNNYKLENIYNRLNDLNNQLSASENVKDKKLIKDKCKYLIGLGNIKDVFDVLVSLDFVNEDIKNQIIVISSTYSELIKQQNIGTINHDDFFHAKARINSGILNIIDEI